jgi:hypothetical protein
MALLDKAHFLKGFFTFCISLCTQKTTFMSTYIMYEKYVERWMSNILYYCTLYVNFYSHHRTSSTFNFNNLFLLLYQTFYRQSSFEEAIENILFGGQAKYNVDYGYYLHNNVWQKRVVKFIFKEPLNNMILSNSRREAI